MPNPTRFSDVEFKNGNSIFFDVPIVITGGYALYEGKDKVVLAQLKNGMLTFTEDDKYFENRPRMIALGKIRDDQIVFV